MQLTTWVYNDSIMKYFLAKTDPKEYSVHNLEKGIQSRAYFKTFCCHPDRSPAKLDEVEGSTSLEKDSSTTLRFARNDRLKGKVLK
jgi:hypothetical protein